MIFTMKRALKGLVASLVFITASQANAALIVIPDINMISSGMGYVGNRTLFSNILDDSTTVAFNYRSSSYSSQLAGYYNSFAGVQVSTGGTIPPTSTFDLLVLDFGFNNLPFMNSAEIAAVSSFLNGGGDVILFGEHAQVTAHVTAYNNILAALGSSIAMTSNKTSTGTSVTSAISVDDLTAGVTSFQYGWSSYLTGGTTLISSGQRAIVAYEEFAVSSTPTPAPTTNASAPHALALMAIGLLAVGRRRRS